MNNGDQEYHVAYADLPPEQPFVFAETEDGELWFIVRREHTAKELEEGWAVFRTLIEAREELMLCAS